jgi:hypothetical protein
MKNDKDDKEDKEYSGVDFCIYCTILLYECIVHTCYTSKDIVRLCDDCASMYMY